MGDLSSGLRTHPSLLVRLRDSADEEAWRQFAEVYAPLVYRCCRRQGLQEADAADVGQEVLSQVVRSLGTFEYQPERGRFRDWFGAVVRSKLARFYQKQARQPATGAAATAIEEALVSEPDAAWTAAFNDHVVRVALERIRPDFKPANWRVFEMVWLENRTSREAAAQMGMSPAAVNVVKWRVLRRLREEVLWLAEDVPHLVPLNGQCEDR